MTARAKYFDPRWYDDVTKPVLEWARTIKEASLTNTQITTVFSDTEKEIRSSLPPGIVKMLQDKISNSKKIKAFDDAFERKKTDILLKHPKFEKVVMSLGQKAKSHPILSGFVIGVLTTAATLATGGVGGFAVGAFLKTSNELLKGERLSKSLAKGAGAGLLGMILGMGIRELGVWLNTFEITSSTVSGYADLVKSSWTHTTNGVVDLNIDAYMTPATSTKVDKLMELADTAIHDGRYEQASEIYAKIRNYFSSEDYRKKITEILANNEELQNKAIAGAKKATSVFNALAAAVQGAATSTAGKIKEGSVPLDEASVTNLLDKISNWAKSGKTLVRSKDLMRAWDKAGNPTESNAVHAVMLQAGVPADVVKKVFLSNNIPLPATPKKKSKPFTIDSGDPELDKIVNEIIRVKGKNAAFKYLLDLKTALASTQTQVPATQPSVLPAGTGPYKNGDTVLASDGKRYRLSVTKKGHRIWFNTVTDEEAPDNIDAELENQTQQSGP